MSDQRLWAPWRLDFIRDAKPDGCVFCAKPALADDESALIVHRGERCFVILNAYPYNNGHLMVSPFKHVASIEQLDEGELLELMTLVQRGIGALREVYAPEGFNIGVNQGAAAGAGIADHLHLHVVPRWGGDTNFMPVIGSTRVLPQALAESWRELSPRFAEAAPG